jgi:LacI family transcriptional regulator
VVLEHVLPGVACIVADDLFGGHLGTEHLLGLGHRRVAHIRRTPDSATSTQRHDGYRDALVAAGIAYDSALVIESGPGPAAGCRAMQRLLALPDPPTAVFAHNDVLALGAMHAIQASGLQIPGDISVVGYDDTTTSAYLHPPLTSVKFPKEEVGRKAGELILRLAQHAEPVPLTPIMLPVELIVRGSTAPPLSP